MSECEIDGQDHLADEVEQVYWLSGHPGGFLNICIVCRKNYEGEWIPAEMAPTNDWD